MWHTLDETVASATRNGLVVYLANSCDTKKRSLPFLKQLAARYSINPHVWLQPMNEPNCGAFGEKQICADWVAWRAEETEYVAAIRNAGFLGLLVVNTPNWSWTMKQLADFRLDDVNIVYGVHRYANDNKSFWSGNNRANDDRKPEREVCDRDWGNLARLFPLVIDEVGGQNTEYSLNLEWNEGFIEYAADWTVNRGGNGVIAYSSYWSDDNSLTGSWKTNRNDGVLTRWGQVFQERYLFAVPGE